MRKKQTIKAVLHIPTNPQALEALREKMCAFYIRQVEVQVEKYDITREQRQQVIAGLAQEYRSKI